MKVKSSVKAGDFGSLSPRPGPGIINTGQINTGQINTGNFNIPDDGYDLPLIH